MQTPPHGAQAARPSGSTYQTIRIHPQAPSKPALGATCNGCGICCLAEPCPLGMVISGRRRGACSALVWNAHSAIYRCGLLGTPAQVAAHLAALPRWWQRGWAWLARPLTRFSARWIGAGIGCDCGYEVPDSGQSATETQTPQELPSPHHRLPHD